MVRFQVKKRDVICFLEAVKLAIDQLGSHRMHLAQHRMESPKELTAIYGEVRRLRDYLQRCLGAHPDMVTLDLEPIDMTHLVACARRGVEMLDLRLESGQTIRPEERAWLQEKRQVLGDWAVQWAHKPLIELPLPRTSQVTTPGVRALNARLSEKVYGPGKEQPLVGSKTTGVDLFGSGPDTRSGMSSGSADTAPDASVAASAMGLADASMGLRDEASTGSSGSALLDVRQVRDPRLRAMMNFDLRAYERAVEARDHRLATVLLSSVMEGALLDHALPRRVELGLAGGPDTWNPQELLLHVLGDRATPKDRSLAFHLFEARNILRPAAQLVSPTAVTPSSLEKLQEFVRLVLHSMGFTRGGDAAETGPLPLAARIDRARMA